MIIPTATISTRIVINFSASESGATRRNFSQFPKIHWVFSDNARIISPVPKVAIPKTPIPKFTIRQIFCRRRIFCSKDFTPDAFTFCRSIFCCLTLARKFCHASPLAGASSSGIPCGILFPPRFVHFPHVLLFRERDSHVLIVNARVCGGACCFAALGGNNHLRCCLLVGKR